MSRVRIHDASENKWVKLVDFLPPESRKELDDKGMLNDVEANSPIRMHEMGDESTLQMFEVQVPPNMSADVHSHEQDEIIYVVSGAMDFGTHSLGPGSSVFIKGQ